MHGVNRLRPFCCEVTMVELVPLEVSLDAANFAKGRGQVILHFQVQGVVANSK